MTGGLIPDSDTLESLKWLLKESCPTHTHTHTLVLPSTQAGLALVVPAIWPFLQAQRAVCLAMVRRGWLLSRSSVTISHVPAASWPGNDIAPQNAGSEGRNHKQRNIKQSVSVAFVATCSTAGLFVARLDVNKQDSIDSEFISNNTGRK